MHSLSALLLAAVAAVPAHAAIVRYDFTATVDAVYEVPAGASSGGFVEASSMAGPTISNGDTWSGSLVYDTALQLAAWQPEQPEGGIYRNYTGSITSTITDPETGLAFESRLTTTHLALMQVYDMPAGTGPDVVSMHTYAPGSALEAGSFVFGDAHGSLLASATPPAGLDLAAILYSSVTYAFRRDSGELMSAQATITSLSFTELPPVPEPSTYAMLGLGLAALAMTKKLRRS
ncbi:MAG TPA: PEP-CTERM sorting domain-containing protein [Pseudoduganella sp.]|jgi:hypothetical protein